MKTKILALMGKAGAGKDTIQKWIVQNIPNTHGIVSCTTRPKRENEVEGIDYHFLTLDEFTQQLLDYRLIEVTKFNNWYYGTSTDEISEDEVNIGVFNVEGVECLLEDGTFEVLPVFISATDKTRLQRQLNREWNPDCGEICRRFLADEKDFADIPFDYVTFDNNPDYKDIDTFHIANIPEIKEFLRGQK